MKKKIAEMFYKAAVWLREWHWYDTVMVCIIPGLVIAGLVYIAIWELFIK